jgi:hypothetical protein
MTTETHEEDVIAAATRQGAEFFHSRDKGWSWGHAGSIGFRNGPCETQEEAAREFLESIAPSADDEDAEPAAGPSL